MQRVYKKTQCLSINVLVRNTSFHRGSAIANHNTLSTHLRRSKCCLHFNLLSLPPSLCISCYVLPSSHQPIHHQSPSTCLAHLVDQAPALRRHPDLLLLLPELPLPSSSSAQCRPRLRILLPSNKRLLPKLAVALVSSARWPRLLRKFPADPSTFITL